MRTFEMHSLSKCHHMPIVLIQYRKIKQQFNFQKFSSISVKIAYKHFLNDVKKHCEKWSPKCDMYLVQCRGISSELIK